MTHDPLCRIFPESWNIDQHAIQENNGVLGASLPPGYDGKLTYYMATTRVADVEELPDWMIANVVNLFPLNYTVHVDRLFTAIHGKLPQHGMLVGCLETRKQVKTRVFSRRLLLHAWLVYGWLLMCWGFLFRFSAIRSLCEGAIQRGHQAFSRTVLNEKLQKAGYEMVEFREIEGLSYFFAMKMRAPDLSDGEQQGGKGNVATKLQASHPQKHVL